MVKRKGLKGFCTAAILGGAISVGCHTTAYAVVTDYALKINEQIYSYNQKELTKSFLDYKIGQKAKLYEDFNEKLKQGNFYAFKDDKKGFISYDNLKKSFLDSKIKKISFDVDKFIQSQECKSIEVSSVKNAVVSKEGVINYNNNSQENLKTEEKKNDEKTESKSSGGSSSSSSSRRKHRDKEEIKEKKNEEEVKKEVEPRKEEVKQVEPVKEEIKEKKNEKEEVKKEVEPKKEEVKQVEPVKEEIKEKKNEKEEVKKEVEPKKEEVKQVKPVREEVNDKKVEKNVEIKSSVVQSYVRGRGVTYQTGHLAFVFKKEGQNKLENAQTIKILDKAIELKKDDSSGDIKKKILKAFAGNPDWKFETGYVVVEEKGASVEYTSNKLIENVDKLAEDSDEIKFLQANDRSGDLGVIEKKEVCEVIITNVSNRNENIRFDVKRTVNQINIFKSITVEVKESDDTKNIAESLYNALNSSTEIKRLFKLKLDKGNSKVILTQILGDNLGTEVSINR